MRRLNALVPALLVLAAPAAQAQSAASAEEEAAGIVLACRVKPRSDIRLTVLGKMKKNVCATPSAAAADARQS